MFTGLVTDLGTIKTLLPSGDNWAVEINTTYPTHDLVLGESIAVDGACLTVTKILDASFTVDASQETLDRTTLGDRKPGDRVHLERALRVGDRLGGHLVLGHVDGVGKIISISKRGNAWIIKVSAPDAVAHYLIDKGSITVDGVSLTVNSVQEHSFELAIIPFTSGETKLADYQIGQRVNLEADVLGKYVEKLMSGRASKRSSLTESFLTEHGFIK